MKYKGEHRYPDFINELAELVGKERRKRNRGSKTDKDEYKRGSEEKENQIDILGAKAELIGQLFIFNENKQYKIEAAPLLSKRAVKKPDVIIHRQTSIRDRNFISIDIKGAGGDINFIYLRVNKKSIEDKPVDYFLFVKPDGEKAKFWTVRRDEICDPVWKLIPGNFNAPYYEHAIMKGSIRSSWSVQLMVLLLCLKNTLFD